MKKQNYLLFLASVMLVAMSFASCKSCNKPAVETQMFGPKSYHLHDYGLFFNNFKQNVADRIKAFTEKK
ncbi:MAG: hypothetical protein II886_06380 [Prevotella sp.]|nr:hypothetical protein [Prevotella sp.]